MAKVPATGRFDAWGSVRYGGFATGGPDALSAYLERTPSQLRALDCAEYKEAIPLLANNAASFSADQRAALKARADECGANNPLLPDFLEGAYEATVGQIANPLTDAVSSALEGAGVILGNVVIAGAGLALIVAGVRRLFGQ